MKHIVNLLQNEVVVLKNVSCLLTLEPAASEYGLQSQTTIESLGMQRDVDVLIERGVVTNIGRNVNCSHLPKAKVIEGNGCLVMPGLVDCHTHPVFGGNRARETVLKAQGLSYEEIAKRGGGIAASTKATRDCSREHLSQVYRRNAQMALSRGVVLMEAKTGYGLNVVEEQKLLLAILNAYQEKNQTLPYCSPTYLAPHAPSPDFNGLDAYIDAIIAELPNTQAVYNELRSAQILPLAVDIFIERNYFTFEQSERWLAAAMQLGCDVHIHADEFSESGGTKLARQFAASRSQIPRPDSQQNGRVLSVDHCQFATQSELTQLAALGVSAVALPTTSFFSNIAYVDSKKFREANINCAIASDFNPGSAPLNNLWFAAYLGLTRCGFSLSEIICAVTLNAARALNADSKFGSIQVGRPANIVVCEGDAPEDFFASPLGDHVKYVLIA